MSSHLLATESLRAAAAEPKFPPECLIEPIEDGQPMQESEQLR
jgi:hypothetical protein